MGNTSKEEEFNRILLESIDETLSILGESTKKVILYFLKQNYEMEEEDMHEDPEILIRGIKEFFGDVGSVFLERRIIKNLYGKMGMNAPSDLSLEDAVKNAKKLYIKI